MDMSEPVQIGAVRMNGRWAVLPLLLIGLAAARAAAGPPSASKSTGPDNFTSYYPDFAKDRAVAGTATIVCKPELGDSLCALYADDPPGFGFGRAALQALKDHPDAPLFKPLTGADSAAAMTFHFDPSPLHVVAEPVALPSLDGRQLSYGFLRRPPMMTIITNPAWATTPSARDFAQAYPPAARLQHIGGLAVLRCTVDAQGNATNCTVIREEPVGLGFGQAALAMAPKFVLKPMTMDGKPVSGGQINIPIRFTP